MDRVEQKGPQGFAGERSRWLRVRTFLAQSGEKHDDAKPLKGFGGASVLEVVESLEGDTFRAVYTVRFAEAVYVLHVFQKKSKSGMATPKQDIELIKARLKQAEQEYTEWKKRR